MLELFSFLGSLFVCSSSSIFMAMILIFFTLLVLMVMYWNMVGVIPLYLFSLFMVGGLYVLIGFVMMADSRDLDLMMTSSKVKEFLIGFLVIILSLQINNSPLDGFDFSSFTNNQSFLNSQSWISSVILSSTFIFLVFFLLIFLFVIHVMMKGSWGGGGFINM